MERFVLNGRGAGGGGPTSCPRPTIDRLLSSGADRPPLLRNLGSFRLILGLLVGGGWNGMKMLARRDATGTGHAHSSRKAMIRGRPHPPALIPLSPPYKVTGPRGPISSAGLLFAGPLARRVLFGLPGGATCNTESSSFGRPSLSHELGGDSCGWARSGARNRRSLHSVSTYRSPSAAAGASRTQPGAFVFGIALVLAMVFHARRDVGHGGADELYGKR